MCVYIYIYMYTYTFNSHPLAGRSPAPAIKQVDRYNTNYHLT